MTDAELAQALNDKKAVVIHFSHHAKMREGGVFPDDLRNAIKNCNQWSLSCCVVFPGHKMDLPGSVGVIFAPDVRHVISVSNTDSGSTTLHNGEDSSDGISLSEQSFNKSLEVMDGRYNEWRIKGAKVFGIYVNNPALILVKQKLTLTADSQSFEDIGVVQVDLSFIKECFPGQQFYTMSSNGLIVI